MLLVNPAWTQPHARLGLLVWLSLTLIGSVYHSNAVTHPRLPADRKTIGQVYMSLSDLPHSYTDAATAVGSREAANAVWPRHEQLRMLLPLHVVCVGQ